jgi:hypothetical protein
LAQKARCAVVLLRHLNKDGRGKALYRGGGSIGIIGAARAGLLVAADPDDADHRILACTKSNLAAPPVSPRFRLVPAATGVCRVTWCGATAYQADDLVGPAETPEERANVQEAAAFLRDLLAAGPLAAEECLRTGRQAGLSEKTLRRAKARLHVRSVRTGDGNRVRWLWVLPELPPSATP